MNIKTTVGRLATLLNQSQIVVCDFETGGLAPRSDAIAGVGFFSPTANVAAYVNVGHLLPDPDFPKATEQELAAAIAPFFGDPARQVVMHNAAFDLRFLFSVGSSRCVAARLAR